LRGFVFASTKIRKLKHAPLESLEPYTSKDAFILLE
jgi:hypothetical protein